MHEDEIPLAFACDRSFADMHIDESGTLRYCTTCDRQVHDLSALPQAQARAIVADRRGRCICFTVDGRGRVRFADDPPLPTTKLRGRPRIRVELAAAALLASIFALGCAAPDDELQATALELDSPDPRPREDRSVIPWAAPAEQPCATPEPANAASPPERAKPRRRKRPPEQRIKLVGGGDPFGGP